MASFDFDQAEGLRRMLAGPKPRIVTVLSVTPDEDKSSMLLNLSASMAQAGDDVLLLDARATARSVGARLDVASHATLLDVARQERALNEAIYGLPQGFCMARLALTPDEELTSDQGLRRRLSTAFGVLARQKGIILIDGMLLDDDSFPLEAMADGDIVIQLSSSAPAIKAAYALIKRLSSKLGLRSFSLLVTGAVDAEAQVVFENIAKAAKRYLSVRLISLGSVPTDEHVTHAAKLGRAVIEAFPMAGASVAFRRLAGQFTFPPSRASLGV